MSDPRAPYVLEPLPRFEGDPEIVETNPMRAKCLQLQDEMAAWAEERNHPAIWEQMAYELACLAERLDVAFTEGARAA